MNLLAWILAGWLLAGLVGGVFALWFGWHLRRYRARHGRPHVHTRAMWLVDREYLDRSDPSGSTTRRK